jgi:hypothetical protein
MDFLEHRSEAKHHYDHQYDNYHFGHGGSYLQGQIGPAILMRLAKSIIRNKTLLIALVIASLILVMLCIMALIKLVPFVSSMFGYVEQSGIKGIVDSILKIGRTLLEAGGKG